MNSVFGYELREKSACGVGFVANLHNEYSHQILQDGLSALCCMEHRGACAADQLTGDGAGIMTDIPFEILGYERGKVAVATLFINKNPEMQRALLKIFEDTFDFFGMKVLAYREVPTNPSILGKAAAETLPTILHAIINKPTHCNTDASFNKLLYTAKQITKTRQQTVSDKQEMFWVSLSVNTMVYKALTRSDRLADFYPDLKNPKYKTRFTLFHRRFSTNTTTTWDKAQPFRLIGHNGEINTIQGNRAWAISREKSLGLPAGELLTYEGISDSGSLNEMVEALLYRSSLPHIEDALALMMPPAGQSNHFYKFWGRAMEPWDGPALIAFSDGENVGARLDRNGFRPCRWMRTKERFYLSSEAGAFIEAEEKIVAKGALRASGFVSVNLNNGKIDFNDPSKHPENDYAYSTRTLKLEYKAAEKEQIDLQKKYLFCYTEEEMNNILVPMISTGKEPIGSMGDTARLAVLSDEVRSLYDYFYQSFAQVTNPPLDYLREKNVTDLTTYIGSMPNIFAKKELIPPPYAIELASPILSLGQMEFIKDQTENNPTARVRSKVIPMTFKRIYGAVGMRAAIDSICQQAIQSVKNGNVVIVLSDRSADFDNLPIPALIAMRAAIKALTYAGLSLKSSIIVDTAQIRTTHQLSTTIGFGASAVCPYLALQIARSESNKNLDKLEADDKEKNLLKAFEGGLLKVMSKMGISVLRSYKSSKLFTIIGLGKNLSAEYFKGVPSLVGGLEFEELVNEIIAHAEIAEKAAEQGKLINNYLFKEHARNLEGEKHSMTNARSKIIHQLVREKGLDLSDMSLYDEYLKLGDEQAEPVSVRHLLDFKKAENPINISEVEPIEKIFPRFGAGAMSFGAISAEAQRDIILAMRQIGGRSNSGEGGENPYYFTEGITASIKQVASGRFGVTATYLVTGNEIQIKIAQGAKPGEGGQLMAAKVNEDIAKARFSKPNVDLISPPPMHDIYSIEDLKQLIFELKQVNPTAKVSVKLVSGTHIGTIALGVAKAGADVIHISGTDGGTGAASLSSMKHAGLPFEFGLLEVHHTLLANGLRNSVTLRTDGGLHTGKDIVMAALMGAEEYEFGRLLLVAEGCVMARICEKNTCPVGIATHNPRFKAKYKGTAEHIVTMLSYLAEDVRRWLAVLGATTLQEIIGKTELLQIAAQHRPLVNKRNLDLTAILQPNTPSLSQEKSINPFSDGVSNLNQRIIDKCKDAIEQNTDVFHSFNICTMDRATGATLSGLIAKRASDHFLSLLQPNSPTAPEPYTKTIHLHFKGSAGQGFGVFLTDHIYMRLEGEANDSVGKTMSGGKLIIIPDSSVSFAHENNVIIGNCAIYGATGGTLYVNGIAGDRFAVRNSGATAVVEGTGLHACEYMTNGLVVILGETDDNIGSGMTGGELITLGSRASKINAEYITEVQMQESDYEHLKALLDDYATETRSAKANEILENWDSYKNKFVKYLPVNVVAAQQATAPCVTEDETV